MVEKQDMEKQEKEAEKVEVKPEENRKGRFRQVKVESKPKVEVIEKADVKEEEAAKVEKAEEKMEEAPVKAPEVVGENLEKKDTSEEPEEVKGDASDKKEEEIEEEEAVAKAIDQGPDQRYLKFDEEIGRGSFKTVFKGELGWVPLLYTTARPTVGGPQPFERPFGCQVPGARRQGKTMMILQ